MIFRQMSQSSNFIYYLGTNLRPTVSRINAAEGCHLEKSQPSNDSDK